MIDVAATLDFTKTSLGLSIADAQEPTLRRTEGIVPP